MWKVLGALLDKQQETVESGLSVLVLCTSENTGKTSSVLRLTVCNFMEKLNRSILLPNLVYKVT